MIHPSMVGNLSWFPVNATSAGDVARAFTQLAAAALLPHSPTNRSRRISDLRFRVMHQLRSSLWESASVFGLGVSRDRKQYLY
jgi:hypothetical protein